MSNGRCLRVERPPGRGGVLLTQRGTGRPGRRSSTSARERGTGESQPALRRGKRTAGTPAGRLRQHTSPRLPLLLVVGSNCRKCRAPPTSLLLEKEEETKTVEGTRIEKRVGDIGQGSQGTCDSAHGPRPGKHAAAFAIEPTRPPSQPARRALLGPLPPSPAAQRCATTAAGHLRPCVHPGMRRGSPAGGGKGKVGGARGDGARRVGQRRARGARVVPAAVGGRVLRGRRRRNRVAHGRCALCSATRRGEVAEQGGREGATA